MYFYKVISIQLFFELHRRKTRLTKEIVIHILNKITTYKGFSFTNQTSSVVHITQLYFAALFICMKFNMTA